MFMSHYATEVCKCPEFRPSYTEYGGYNGYDDNTIDSAFEGMPEATWNID